MSLIQVPKEDFEVLSKYFPGEIRYYIDKSEPLSHRRKATRVTVKRKYKSKKKDKAAAPMERAINGTGVGHNKPIRYTGSDAGYQVIGSISKKVEATVGKLYSGDPTRVFGQSDLINLVVREANLTKANVAPVISDLLKRDVLRVKTVSA